MLDVRLVAECTMKRMVEHLVTADACIVGAKQTVLDAKLKNGDWLQAVLMMEDDKIHAMVEDRKLGIKSSFAEFEGAYVLVSEERSGDYTPAHRAMTEKHTFWGPWLPATVVGGDLPKICQKKWGGPGWQIQRQLAAFRRKKGFQGLTQGSRGPSGRSYFPCQDRCLHFVAGCEGGGGVVCWKPLLLAERPA